MARSTQREVAPVKVLILEDNRDDALLLLDALEQSGFQIESECVDNEPAFVLAIENKQWDIVLSDYQLPGFTGKRALALFREINEFTPFVLVSGTIGEELAVEIIKAGANDYILKDQLGRLKPVISRELREAAERTKSKRNESLLRQLSRAVEQTSDSIFITDVFGHMIYANPAFTLQTGYTFHTVEGQTPEFLFSSNQKFDSYFHIWQQVSHGERYRGVILCRRRDGSVFHEELSVSPLFDSENEIIHFVFTGRDISQRIEAEESRNQLASILEMTPDIVAMMEPSGPLIYLNGAGRRLLGIASNAEIAKFYIKDIFPGQVASFLSSTIIPHVYRDGAWAGETELLNARGETLPISLVVLEHKDNDGSTDYLSLIARDISERKTFEAELQHRATHDALTNLPNRFCLMERFHSSIDYATRRGDMVAVYFLDLDDFKRVNDSLGHAAGDELLKQISRRLQSSLRPSDTVARHGGDEFVIIVGDLTNLDAVMSVWSKVRKEFERPIMINAHEVYVSFSTGVAVYPHDGDSPQELLRHADSAMYTAKLAGSDQCRFYSADMQEQGREHLLLEAELRRALELQEFCLFYQPQVDAKTGKIVGFEALLRWQHALRGLVSPGDFIPLLEKSSLIIPVGEWVIREACRFHCRLRDAGFTDIRLAVNVSAFQFIDKDFYNKVHGAISDFDIPEDMLELEITENLVMKDPDNAAQILQSLQQIGVRASMDDFGTGYSSLAYLKRFPVAALKIDRTFVRDLTIDNDDAAIVEATLLVAQKLGLEVVAEGVETKAQLKHLQTLNCPFIQGFLISPPVHEDAVLVMLEQHQLLDENDWPSFSGAGA